MGGYINPVVNGVTAPSEVKVDIVDVEEEVSGSFKVKKIVIETLGSKGDRNMQFVELILKVDNDAE